MWPAPTLAVNHTSGAPGSYFTYIGVNFPTNSTATISVNGLTFGSVTTGDNGGFAYVLATVDADEGYYLLR